MNGTKDIVLAITGASGAIYAVRLLEVLVALGKNVHLTISPAAAEVLRIELDLHVDLEHFRKESLLPDETQLAVDSKLQLLRSMAGISSESSNVLAFEENKPGEIFYHHHQNITAPIASGSFLTGGMVICPCSGGTLSAVAHGSSGNLIQRAADVHLKERRPLILTPRETPLSLIYLDNMRRCVEAGAIMLPAMPGFYHNVRSVQDLADFIVARICDQLKIENSLMNRWGGGGDRDVF